jgi:hypothetical protein
MPGAEQHSEEGEEQQPEEKEPHEGEEWEEAEARPPEARVIRSPRPCQRLTAFRRGCGLQIPLREPGPVDRHPNRSQDADQQQGCQEPEKGIIATHIFTSNFF